MAGSFSDRTTAFEAVCGGLIPSPAARKQDQRDKLRRFYGNLPIHNVAQNKGRLDRSAVAALFGFPKEMIDKAYYSWHMLFRISGTNLTFEQYLNKMVEAGITPAQIGNKSEQYNLARYGDRGSYTETNCRFITKRENIFEQESNICIR